MAYLPRSSPLQFAAHMACSFVRKREQQGQYHGIPEPDVVVRCNAQFLEDHPEAREEEVHPRKVGEWWSASLACLAQCVTGWLRLWLDASSCLSAAHGRKHLNATSLVPCSPDPT